MKNTKEVTVKKEELVSVTCDKCGVDIPEYSMDNDYISCNHTFGYGTEMDGINISFDLCVSCFMDIIKDIKYRKREMF